jgi:hypothetical protein
LSSFEQVPKQLLNLNFASNTCSTPRANVKFLRTNRRKPFGRSPPHGTHVPLPHSPPHLPQTHREPARLSGDTSHSRPTSTEHKGLQLSLPKVALRAREDILKPPEHRGRNELSNSAALPTRNNFVAGKVVKKVLPTPPSRPVEKRSVQNPRKPHLMVPVAVVTDAPNRRPTLTVNTVQSTFLDVPSALNELGAIVRTNVAELLTVSPDLTCAPTFVSDLILFQSNLADKALYSDTDSENSFESFDSYDTLDNGNSTDLVLGAVARDSPLPHRSHSSHVHHHHGHHHKHEQTHCSQQKHSRSHSRNASANDMISSSLVGEEALVSLEKLARLQLSSVCD